VRRGLTLLPRSSLAPVVSSLLGPLQPMQAIFARHNTYALSRVVTRIKPGSTVPNQITRDEKVKGSRRSVCGVCVLLTTASNLSHLRLMVCCVQIMISESGRDAFVSSTKSRKPTTPSNRHVVFINRPYLWKGR
jgi:hypothetical protein